MFYDVIIIGGGPAGATFARLAPSDSKILLLDGSPLRFGGKGKPCGGLLAPDAQKIISRFGMKIPSEVLTDPQIDYVKTIDYRSGIIRNYGRTYINISRPRFDEWLLSLCGENTEVRIGVCNGISRTEKGFEIRYRTESGDTVTAGCGYLVGADGASSVVRRFAYPKAKPRMYTAVQQRFRDDGAKPLYSCIFDEEITDCCSWTISKSGYTVFGGAYPMDRPRERFEEQKKRLEKFGYDFREPFETECCTVLRPRSGRDFFLGNDGVFLIGEAAGFVSPSSLEGISYAMRSGAALASAMRRKNPERAYRRETFGLRAKLIRKTLKCPFMYQPTLRRAVMKSGLMSIKRDFCDGAEKTK